jgi:acetyl esterase/lipase
MPSARGIPRRIEQEASPMSNPDAPATEIPAWMGDVDPSQIGFPFPPDRSRYEKRVEIPYKETPEGPLHLDAYRPVGPGRAPLVVMIHGGGWHQGGRYEMGLSRWAGWLAGHGLAVASIDYRLAPGTTYPHSFGDCLDAIDWCVENADELGVDASRIGLWGDSAGGHLVLLVATSQTRADFAGPRLRHAGDSLRACTAWYPPTDLETLHGIASRHEGQGVATVRAFVGVDPEDDPARWREASPLHQLHDRVPPTLVLQGTRDVLVPHTQATAYAERAREVGGHCELHIVEGGVHGFERVVPDAEARAKIERCRDFLVEHLDAG